jgi:hypothetical protein
MGPLLRSRQRSDTSRDGTVDQPSRPAPGADGARASAIEPRRWMASPVAPPKPFTSGATSAPRSATAVTSAFLPRGSTARQPRPRRRSSGQSWRARPVAAAAWLRRVHRIGLVSAYISCRGDTSSSSGWLATFVVTARAMGGVDHCDFAVSCGKFQPAAAAVTPSAASPICIAGPPASSRSTRRPTTRRRRTSTRRARPAPKNPQPNRSPAPDNPTNTHIRRSNQHSRADYQKVTGARRMSGQR